MSSTRYRFAVRVDVIAPNGKRIKDLVIAYPRETKERALQLFERIAAGLNQVDLSTAQETPPEPGMHRNQVIARARMAHGGKWPAELTSGVMFYEGMRVTREDFEHR